MGTDVTLANDLSRRWSILIHESKLEIYVTPNYFYEIPQLIVSLPSFQIDRVKVTNARYRLCVLAGICRSYDWGEQYEYEQYRIPPHYSEDRAYADYPALAAWEDANAYCHWVGKRLPIEAEWEKAARGTDGRLYPWGNEWNMARVAQEVSPVGSHPDGASTYGALDMIGNLPEWTLNPLQPYPSNSFELPLTLYKDVSQVKAVRGGYVTAYGLGLDAQASTRRANNAEGVPASFRCVQGEQPVDLPSVVVAYQPVVPPTPAPHVTNLSQMVYVPAGEFVMGLDEVTTQYPELRRNASPQHLVYLDTFYIDKYEVTNAEYVAFLNVLGQDRFACGGYDCARVRRREDSILAAIIVEFLGSPNTYKVPVEYENHPATEVSWYGSKAYCTWRSKRLPTEAEWEKAARGTDGRLYPWGNTWDNHNFADGQDIIRGVGFNVLDISPYGTADMFDNASEWVFDWFDPDYYSVSPYRNPQGPEQSFSSPFGLQKVTRSHSSEVAKPWGISFRSRGTATSSSHGFRCAYTPR